MPTFTKIGGRYFNFDAAYEVETSVRAQHPDRSRPIKEQFVDDAVRVHFQGSNEPREFFDNEADDVLKIIDPAAKPIPAKATATTDPVKPAVMPAAKS